MNELDRVEAQAYRDVVERAELVGGAMCLSTPALPAYELNRAVPLGEAVDIDAIARWFGETPHIVSVSPGQEYLEEQLADLGYTRAYGWMKFERGIDPAPATTTDLRIEETLDRAAFALCIEEGFGAPGADAPFVGSPGWRCFLAWDGAEPAACGAVYADGDIAWLGIGATRPAFRRRGAQNALLAARIDAARETARVVTTETGDRIDGQPGQSYRNILRAGFREAYLRPNWNSPSP